MSSKQLVALVAVWLSLVGYGLYKNIKLDSVAPSENIPRTTAISATEHTKKITHLDLSSDQVIYINDVISVNSRGIVAEIKAKGKFGKELFLLIDSPGGSVLDGAQIIAAMQSSPVPVNTVCMQLCASMAFMIHQYGSTRYAIDRAMLMAHPAAGGFNGPFTIIESRYRTISRYVDKMDFFVAKRMGKTLEEFKAMFATELWIDSEDSLEAGLLDHIASVNTDAPEPTQLLIPSEKLNIKKQLDVEWL